MRSAKKAEKIALLLSGIVLMLLGLGFGFLLGVGIYFSWGRPVRDVGVDAQPEFAVLVGLLMSLGMIGSGAYLVIAVFRGGKGP